MADHPSPVAAELIEARDLCLLADPVQLDLIADQVPGRDAGTVAAVAERRGRGRPRGALNKRNAKFRDQLLALYGHPAEALARAAFTPVDQLAAQLDCTKYEAAQLAIRAGAELLPYVEGKQPVQVEVTRRNDVVMIMPGGGMTGAQVEALAQEIRDGDEDGIDWASAEVGDLADLLPSLSGEPSQGVLQGEAAQSAAAGENGAPDAGLRA